MLMVEELGEGRYRVSYEQLDRPTVRGDYEISGFGKVVLDDADVHYAKNHPETAAFFVRKSRHLGDNHYVVISRVRNA